MSLYRQYRPTTFADVAGQEHIVTTLEQAVKQDKLSHAYLFAGSRGTGKTSIARILAKVMITRGIGDTTLREQIIRGVDEGHLVDFTEIDAASNRGIDDIRSLLEKIQFSPVVATAKVYIIDEVHMLTREAFNALLKTLEEPPVYAYFILATTELHKIPATIQSRCQRFLFRQIREEDIVRRLQYIADQEHITVERTALRAIAHHVQGSMRDAIGLLDQLRSLETITTEDVRQRIGETGHEYVEQMLAALCSHDPQAVLALSRRMEEAAVPLENFLRLLLGATHEELRAAVENGHDTAASLRRLDVLLTTIRDLRIAPVPGLVLESALIALCQETMDISPTKKPETPATKRAPHTATSPDIPAPAPPRAEEKRMESEPQAARSEAPSLTMEQLQTLWPDIMRALEPASVRMSLKNGHLHAIEGGKVIVSFTSAFHRDKVMSIEAARAIEAALERTFKRTLRLKCILETEEHVHGPTQGDVVNLAEAAAEIF